MESRPLRYFVAVARTCSITRAAEQLGMAQPPLSRQIQALERELGAQLFDRKNGLRLTRAGEALLAKAEPALALLDSAKASVAEAGGPAQSTLSLGFVAAAGYGLLPRLTRAFNEAHPEVDLQIRCLTNSEQREALKRGEIQLGIAWLPFEGREFASVPLETDRFFVALPTGHRLCAQHTVAPEDLHGERLILGCRHAGIARVILRALHGNESEEGWAAARKAKDLSEALDGVASGLGITFVPGAMMSGRSAHVEYRRLVSAEFLTLGVVYGEHEAEAARRFLSVQSTQASSATSVHSTSAPPISQASPCSVASSISTSGRPEAARRR